MQVIILLSVFNNIFCLPLGRHFSRGNIVHTPRRIIDKTLEWNLAVKAAVWRDLHNLSFSERNYWHDMIHALLEAAPTPKGEGLVSMYELGVQGRPFNNRSYKAFFKGELHLLEESYQEGLNASLDIKALFADKEL